MNKKLHILFLCGWYPSKVLPTNGDFIQRHAEAVSLQHNVSVLHLISNKNIKQTIIDIQTINGIKTYIGYIKYTTNPLLKVFRFFSTYNKLLKKIKLFDLVHLNTLFPFGIFVLHLKLFQKKPFIISEHWSGYLTASKKRISFTEKIISKYITKKAEFICPVSLTLQNSMKNTGLIGRYQPVPNVVNTKIFFPKEKKNNQFTIIHVSNFDSVKNIESMLIAAKKLEGRISKFTWKFIGGKSNNYTGLIKKLNFKSAKIEFINHIPQQELATHLQTANVYVSFSSYETFGITMIEAISCGTYVICTKTGVLNEFENQNYFSFVDFNDITDLENKIFKIHKKSLKLDTTRMYEFVTTYFSPVIISNSFSNLYFKALH